MWATLINALSNHFNQNLTDVLVYTNTQTEPVKQLAIEIIRAPQETQFLNRKAKTGTFNLTLILWAYDAEDPNAANIALQELELNVADTIKTFIPSFEGYNLAIKADRVRPDGDVHRPCIGSEVTLEITWRKV